MTKRISRVRASSAALESGARLELRHVQRRNFNYQVAFELRRTNSQPFRNIQVHAKGL